MGNLSILRGTPISNSTSLGALSVATLTAVTGRINYVTDVSFSTDKLGVTVTVLDPTKGTLWQVIASNGSQPFVVGFNSPLAGSVNTNVTLNVPGSSATTANIGGYVL